MDFQNAKEFVEQQRLLHAVSLSRFRARMIYEIQKQGLDIAAGGIARFKIKTKEVAAASLICEEFDKKGLKCGIYWETGWFERSWRVVRIELAKKK